MSNLLIMQKVVKKIFKKMSYGVTSASVISVCCLLALIISASASHAKAIDVSFKKAMQSLNFELDADLNGLEGANGIPEGVEMAMLSTILANDDLDLSKTGGVTHQAVSHAYSSAIAKAKKDVQALLAIWPSSAEVVVGYTMLGSASFEMINRMTTGHGVPLHSDYSVALALEDFLSPEGDADGDGFSNRQEYHAFASQGQAAYIAAALDPNNTPTKAQLADMKAIEKTRFTLGIVLYSGFEVLDVYGPLEMWGYVPNFHIVLIAEKAGPVRSAQGAVTEATYSFEDAPKLDIVMVPGGNGTKTALKSQPMMSYLKKVNEDTLYTTSVCTGSALLAKAGILDGHRATTNKRFFFLSEQQSERVDWVENARWVESGKVFTSSGVSAGTDMALGLVAKMFDSATARELASAVEYVWHEQSDNDPFVAHVNRLMPVVSGLTENEGGERRLVKSMPAANAALRDAPRYIHLVFNELPDVADSDVALYSVNNRSEPIFLKGLHTMGANDLMISVGEELASGEYIVEWGTTFATTDTVSKQGSTKEGSTKQDEAAKLSGIFHFNVGDK